MIIIFWEMTPCGTLKMETIRSSETSVLIRATRCHFPEDDNHSHRRGNLKSYKCLQSSEVLSTYIVTYMEWLQMGFELMIGFTGLFDTARDYTLQFTIIYTHTSVHSHVFTSRCSVAASKGGHSPSSRFSNYPRPQLPASNSNSSQWLNLSSSLTNSVTHQPTNCAQLTNLTPINCFAYNISAPIAQKTTFLLRFTCRWLVTPVV
jgi:hypothetical protein